MAPYLTLILCGAAVWYGYSSTYDHRTCFISYLVLLAFLSSANLMLIISGHLVMKFHYGTMGNTIRYWPVASTGVPVCCYYLLFDQLFVKPELIIISASIAHVIIGVVASIRLMLIRVNLSYRRSSEGWVINE